jgi:hypothetical protein
MLWLEGRLKATYPDMRFEIKNEFSARLSGRSYTEDGWSAAESWRLRPR